MTMYTKEVNLSRSPTWAIKIAHFLFPRDPLIALIRLRRRVLEGDRSPDNLRKMTELRRQVTEIVRPE